ncbi:MAG: hypothetical protein SFV15_27230 [Polyangiaceae bacterium]|nr:hypothetical protein [Polyangiaceae bacterium]
MHSKAEVPTDVGTRPTQCEEWVEDTDIVDVSLVDRVHIVERVAELHARRVQAGLLSLPVFALNR